jgi:F-type H+-transporting ATPase subunit alpha
MAELTLSAADIAAVLKKNLEGFEPSLEATTVGRIVLVGDGIARVSGLPLAAVNELLEFEDGTLGLALNLDEETIGAVILGDGFQVEEGQSVKAPAASCRCRSVTRYSVAGERDREPVDGFGPRRRHHRRMEIQAIDHGSQAGARADADRHQVDRCHDPDRAHQREWIIGPQDGKTSVASTRSGTRRVRREVHLRRHRPEAVDGRPTVDTLRSHGAMGVHRRRHRGGVRSGPFKYLACMPAVPWASTGWSRASTV